MGSESVRVWVATDANGSQWVSREQPKWIDCEAGFDLGGPFDTFGQAIGISVPPRQCREFVLIPADEYRQPTAELSPVAKWHLSLATAAMQSLIAKIPLFDRQGEHGVSAPSAEEIHQVRRDVAESAFDYADAMVDELEKRSAAARKIESVANQ